ncbi:MAG: tRNA pseudouridine(55) synthase TruB [Oscillospiraceae bacterium]|nr:tRNA pseudouridine(55) synthase TruB [Oscillospiraceae bacterium]
MAELSGVLVMNKPRGFTSFDVIGKLRGILKMRRLGHTGTLDPMAEGVLPVLVGTAARACDILPDETKSYRAGFRLGVVTDTQDVTGTVLSQSTFHVTDAQLQDVFERLTGDIMQIPPMFSAVQINGKRLYELAREGKEIERPARKVHIAEIICEAFDPETGEGIVSITCGKGTYVRTILHDAGQMLGCGCIMKSLVRTAACGFRLEDAMTFEVVQKYADEGKIPQILIPTDRLFQSLPSLQLNASQTKHYRNGVKLNLCQLKLRDSDRYRVYAEDDTFLGLADADRQNSVLRIYKNL